MHEPSNEQKKQIISQTAPWLSNHFRAEEEKRWKETIQQGRENAHDLAGYRESELILINYAYDEIIRSRNENKNYPPPLISCGTSQTHNRGSYNKGNETNIIKATPKKTFMDTSRGTPEFEALSASPCGRRKGNDKGNIWLGFEEPGEGVRAICPRCSGILEFVNLGEEEGAFWVCECGLEIYEWDGYNTITMHSPVPERSNE